MSSHKGKNRQFATAAAALSLVGLSYYLYRKVFANEGSTSTGRGVDGTTPEKSSISKKKQYKATLSLSLPATFLRNEENTNLLKGLLRVISENYIVTLIAPPPTTSRESADIEIKTHLDHPAVDPSGSGIDTVAELSRSLADVPNFDSRRVLEYSKEEGRLALARALACDAHCEVMISLSDRDDLHQRQSRRVDGETEGGITPRASSPHHSHHLKNNIANEDQEVITLLEQYHADMARIRKSSTLLIFLILPLKLPTSKIIQSALASRTSISNIEVETMIQPFLLPGQQELSSRVPGVKIIDARTSKDDENAKAWTKAAQRILALSEGWQ